MEAKHDVINAVRQMVDAVNRAEFSTAVAAFSQDAAIVEDIAPYIWRGPGAPSDWLAAMGANAASMNIQSVLMTLAEPNRVEVHAEAAYALFPGELRMVAAGADLVADGSLTLTLRRSGDRWLIDSLAWSGPKPSAS